jgi:hypothetical protein
MIVGVEENPSLNDCCKGKGQSEFRLRVKIIISIVNYWLVRGSQNYIRMRTDTDEGVIRYLLSWAGWIPGEED